MADSYVFVKQNYKEVFDNYFLIDNTKQPAFYEEKIIYDDMIFERKGEWCLITLIPGDVYAEEILLQLSNGNRLLYFYTDEDQLDCEFLVIEKNLIVRKLYIYNDTEELNENEGKLLCESEMQLEKWYDLDKLIAIAFEAPDELFK